MTAPPQSESDNPVCVVAFPRVITCISMFRKKPRSPKAGLLSFRAAGDTSAPQGQAHHPLIVLFKTLCFHPTLHGRVAGCFGTGASTERLVPLVGYLGLIGSRPQLQPVGPAPSHTLCFDFGWHAPNLALGCDENAALPHGILPRAMARVQRGSIGLSRTRSQAGQTPKVA